MNNDYVLKHDYGYGKEPEQIELNKLELRNMDDLKTYIFDAIDNLFVALRKNNVVEFLTDNSKTQVMIEEI